MLKRLTLENFVHFSETTTFDFNGGGSYFFIGENRSGKSCASEAIRRCMSTSKNFFLSSSQDKSNFSVVICEYTNNLVSCYVRIPHRDVVLKIAFDRSKHSDTFVDLLKNNKDGYPVNTPFLLNEATRTLFHNKLGEVSTENLVSCVKRIILSTKAFETYAEEDRDSAYNSKTECELFLKNYIDTEVVITEPMRSISPVQWTKSEKFDNLPRTKKGVTFLTEMRDRSEIMRWFLDSDDISKSERVAVDRYFDVLTEGSELEFKMQNDTIVVKDNGNVVSLEKAPEGIFEARICAILLSIDRFKTICLEEPGRGMHPQMIERMRDLILKKIEDKTIIIISHIPTFLTCWNMKNVYLFRRPVKHGPFTVVSGQSLLPPDEHKTHRMITDNSWTTIFFARRILLVEGESELMFMSAVKEILLNDDTLAERVITPTKIDVTLEQLNRFLSSLHILSLHGETNKLRLQKLCKALRLDRYFVLDYDALLEYNEHHKHSTDQFFKKFELTELQDDFERQSVKVLEKEGIFVWSSPSKGTAKASRKDGTIESALISLTELPGTGVGLKKIFDENNAFQKNKLFISKCLNQENINKVVKEVIQCCIQHPESDVFRLMKFLLNAVATQSQLDAKDPQTYLRSGRVRHAPSQPEKTGFRDQEASTSALTHSGSGSASDSGSVKRTTEVEETAEAKTKRAKSDRKRSPLSK